MAFWQFLRNCLIGWIGHALLVQPFISAHRKWPEMVVSASTNQIWTKITIGSYSHVFCHSESDNRSSVSSNTLLRLLRIFMRQTLVQKVQEIHKLQTAKLAQTSPNLRFCIIKRALSITLLDGFWSQHSAVGKTIFFHILFSIYLHTFTKHIQVSAKVKIYI